MFHGETRKYQYFFWLKKSIVSGAKLYVFPENRAKEFNSTVSFVTVLNENVKPYFLEKKKKKEKKKLQMSSFWYLCYKLKINALCFLVFVYMPVAP